MMLQVGPHTAGSSLGSTSGVRPHVSLTAGVLSLERVSVGSRRVVVKWPQMTLFCGLVQNL